MNNVILWLWLCSLYHGYKWVLLRVIARHPRADIRHEAYIHLYTLDWKYRPHELGR